MSKCHFFVALCTADNIALDAAEEKFVWDKMSNLHDQYVSFVSSQHDPVSVQESIELKIYGPGTIGVLAILDIPEITVESIIQFVKDFQKFPEYKLPWSKQEPGIIWTGKTVQKIPSESYKVIREM